MTVPANYGTEYSTYDNFVVSWTKPYLSWLQMSNNNVQAWRNRLGRSGQDPTNFSANLDF